ncbi:MAG: hypothetical protein ACRYGM_29345 [Janthinobacterium lividum]
MRQLSLGWERRVWLRILLLYLSLFAIAPSDFAQQDGYGCILNVHPENLASTAFRARINLCFAEPDEQAPARSAPPPSPAA